MEKWAQTMNKQKEAMKGFNAALKAMNGPNERKESATADAGYAILEKSVSHWKLHFFEVFISISNVNIYCKINSLLLNVKYFIEMNKLLFAFPG